MTFVKTIFTFLRGIVTAFIFFSCIDPIFVESEKDRPGSVVIDGLITDEPGPHTVKVFRASKALDNLQLYEPINVKQIAIIDSTGLEIPLEGKNGVYKTNIDVRGTVGMKYFLRVVLLDGTIIESVPDQLRPSGEIADLYFEFVSKPSVDGVPQRGFKILVNSVNNIFPDTYVRWRFQGTYNVANCFVPQYEDLPVVQDNGFVTDGNFFDVQVGYVPANEWTFFGGRYMVEVKQMSLSPLAHQFWKTIQDQKRGAETLFQPPYGNLVTNLKVVSGAGEVEGIFYASSVCQKVIFITRNDVPFKIEEPYPPLTRPCQNIFIDASFEKPPEWP